MIVPKAGHLFRLSLFALFLGLLAIRISVDILDSGRKAERAKAEWAEDEKSPPASEHLMLKNLRKEKQES